MFEFFKKKNLSKDIVQEIAIYAKNFDAKIKQVENLNKIGRNQDAEIEITFICRKSISLFLYKYGAAEEVKQIQYICLVDLLRFLNAHGYDKLFAEVSKEVSRQLSRFKATELGMLSHIMGLKIESVKKEEGDVRLVFYACQNCGNLNLIVTEPCINCSYIPKCEKELRRSLLLNSKFIYPKHLLEISRKISISYHGNPRGQSLLQIWGSSDIDQIAYAKTEKINLQVAEMLQKCVSKINEPKINFKINYNCQSCTVINVICADKFIQKCQSCGINNNIPTFKLYKAALIDSLDYIRMACVVGDDIKLANCIAEMTLHYEYALRRNQYPSLSQRADLRQRFELIKVISYSNEDFKLNFESGVFTWTSRNDVDEEALEHFEYHVACLKTLFKIMEMDIAL